MTALFLPVLQVLTVMNIFPRRRRSARVNNKLPRGQVDIAETTPTEPDKPSHAPPSMCHEGIAQSSGAHGAALRQTQSPTGVGYGKLNRHILPTSQLKTKGENFNASSSAHQESYRQEGRKEKQLALRDVTRERTRAISTGYLRPCLSLLPRGQCHEASARMQRGDTS